MILLQHWTAQFWPLHNVTTSAVLHLSEDAELTVDEVRGGGGGGGKGINFNSVAHSSEELYTLYE